MRIPLVAATGLFVCLNVPVPASAQDASSRVGPLPVRPPVVPSSSAFDAPKTFDREAGTLVPAHTPEEPGETIGASIPSFSHLFKSVGTDFRNLPSRENALLLAIGAGLAGASHPIERDLTEDWSRPGPHAAILRPGSIVGNSYLHLGAAFALYAAGRSSHNSRLGLFGADLLRAQILAQSTTFALKFAAGRTRPNGEPRSFPSGHTSTMFATATVVQQHFGWRAGIPAFAAAAYVGAQRIQDSKHHLSDVAFGAALGIIAGRTVTIGHRGMKFALTPVSGRSGGVGIGLTRVH